MLSDTLEALRPNLVRFSSVEQASEAVRAIEAEDAKAAGLAVNGNAKAPATPVRFFFFSSPQCLPFVFKL